MADYQGFELPSGDIILRKIDKTEAGCGAFILLAVLGLIGYWQGLWNKNVEARQQLSFDRSVKTMNEIIKKPSVLAIYAENHDGNLEGKVVERVETRLSDLEDWLVSEGIYARFVRADLGPVFKPGPDQSISNITINGWMSKQLRGGWFSDVPIIVWWESDGKYYRLDQMYAGSTFQEVPSIPSIEEARRYLGKVIPYESYVPRQSLDAD